MLKGAGMHFNQFPGINRVILQGKKPYQDIFLGQIVFKKTACSRNHKGVGVAREITSPKNQLQFSLTMMGQYWLWKTKPKQPFRLTRIAFNKLLWNF